MLYIYFLCLTNENIFEWRCPSSFPTFRAFCYLHSFESWRLVLLCRCFHYRGFTLKTFINSDAFYDFATVNGKPSPVATRQFPVSRRSNVHPVLWRFRFFIVSRSNFLHSDRLMLVASFFPYNLNTAIKLIRIQLIYSWLFYSVGSITKK